MTTRGRSGRNNVENLAISLDIGSARGALTLSFAQTHTRPVRGRIVSYLHNRHSR
jgi:hypothetical protein